MQDEDEEVDELFKMDAEDDDLDMTTDGINDFGLDEEDPDKDH